MIKRDGWLEESPLFLAVLNMCALSSIAAHHIRQVSANIQRKLDWRIVTIEGFDVSLSVYFLKPE